MRIALLSSQWPGVRLGGIGAYTLHCAQALARAGHEPHVFTLPLPADARQNWPPMIHLHQIQEPSQARALSRALPMGAMLKYHMALQRQFAAAVRAAHQVHPFDILEAPEYEAPALPLVESRDIPVITLLHSGTAIARDGDQSPLGQEQALRETLELHVIAAARGICAPTRAVLAETRRAYRLPDLAPDARIIPLPFAVPDTPFELPPAGAPVLYIGRLEYLKGTHLLAQAAPDFLRRHPAAQLRIIGPDTMTAPDGQGRRSNCSMAQWMRARLAEFAGRVAFLGQRSAEEITAELRRAAFVIIPSLRENFSYVCCEALAAGRPVLVSAGIGAAEVAGDAGLPFARGDAGDLARAMDQLWTDDALRAGLSHRAWDRARTALSPQRAIAQRLAFYEEIIQGFKSPGTGSMAAQPPALPPTHAARLRVAQALADGDAVALAAFLQQAGLPPAALTPGQRLLQCLAAHAAGAPVRFHLYGAGRHTARLLMEQPAWQARGYELVGLIDDHPRFSGEPRCYGLPVVSCASAEAQFAPGDLVILSTDAFEEQFWENTQPLRAKGVTVYRLYT